MKKWFLGVLLLMILLVGSIPVHASSENGSPQGSKITTQEVKSSPKTGDMPVLAIGALGGICAAAAAVTARKKCHA